MEMEVSEVSEAKVENNVKENNHNEKAEEPIKEKMEKLKENDKEEPKKELKEEKANSVEKPVKNSEEKKPPVGDTTEELSESQEDEGTGAEEGTGDDEATMVKKPAPKKRGRKASAGKRKRSPKKERDPNAPPPKPRERKPKEVQPRNGVEERDGTRRERKQVERFSFVPDVEKEEALTIVPGTGVKLADIPFIADQINKQHSSDLTILHRLFYNRRGTANEVKKNIRQFSGFNFELDSPECAKKKAVMQKWETRGLKSSLSILGLKQSGNKEEGIDRIVEFLLCPSDQGVKVAPKGSKGRASSSSGKKRASSAAKGKRSPKKASPRKKAGKKGDSESEQSEPNFSDEDESPKAKASSEEEEYEEGPPRKRGRSGRQASAGKKYIEPDDVETDEERDLIIVDKEKKKEKVPPSPKKPKEPKEPKKEVKKPAETKIEFKDDISEDSFKSESDEDVDSEEEKKKKKAASKKKAAVTKKKAPTPRSKATPVQKKGPAKKPTLKKKVESDEDEEDEETNEEMNKSLEESAKSSQSEDEDDEPLIKKKKTSDAPTEDEIKKVIEKILDGADLAKVSMKKVLGQVAEEFPGVNLESKKQFMKDTVTELL